uniref:Uncharacterized protein n=1 Tax=Chromera velia CCMP2878 TaxID=1169474 RepID=A0A0G4FRJ0_9ALVE|eukprot:Cvel_18397.t1-p1 / transcript=Cvel_18397.t1 / gene=Cvel_18397 / organism=Chromera_velia_CCMP2878 / gene_product=hypothetical protein / transcript_product=hypothetical protein / location=Cvel_scaffold1521:2440-3508(+) / protein_length=231 / sequence_SO=supercontig / SO=protein_coding / is_pseudo=false
MKTAFSFFVAGCLLVFTMAQEQQGIYCNQGHDGNTNPCNADRTDFCCNYDCTHCGPRSYCEQYSPFQAHSGVCQPSYVGSICANYFQVCDSESTTPRDTGIFVDQNHDGQTNPCNADRTDYCCDYACTHCGPRAYCEQYSPFQAHSGICEPAYVGGVCANYFQASTDAEKASQRNLRGGVSLETPTATAAERKLQGGAGDEVERRNLSKDSKHGRNLSALDSAVLSNLSNQ